MATASFDLHLNDGWYFKSGELPRAAKMCGDEYHASSKAGGALKCLVGFSGYDGWRSVSLPHDWLTEEEIDPEADATPGCKRRTVAWYKTAVKLPNEPIESAELCFEGVLGISTVYVNGVLAKRNFSGYNRFSFEIGDYLLAGEENEIAVFVNARRHEGWWYEGAGIYRPVYIRFRGTERILKDECFVRTVKNAVLADIKFTQCGKLRAELFDKDGGSVTSTIFEGVGDAAFELAVDSPLLWSPEHPSLYTLHVTLEKDEKVLDRVEFSVGFRDISWDSGKGMLLNGDVYRIKGICCHQDHAGLGAAVYPEVEEYRITRLKSLGANAYRCAHHAPSESLLDICDRLGMLVLVENRHFDISDSTMAELDALVKLSRSHPCVFAYCLFNEEPWQADKRGGRIAARMRERIRLLDSTRAVTAAQNGGILLEHNASETLDVIGINYNLNAYENCHIQNPDKVIIGTENSPTFATRGIYTTDRNAEVFADDGSEYPKSFSEPLWETMAVAQRHKFVAGTFVWSGFDHRGEPNPFEYPSVFSHWGFLDNCGFDKNISNWLRAYYLEEPFLRFASFGNIPSGKTRQVLIYTNGEECELFVDGISLGTKKCENRTAEWIAPNSTREFRAVTKIGEHEISEIYREPKAKAKLSVTDTTPKDSPRTIRILNISVTDEDGNVVRSENGMLKIEGKILGVGNGDPRSHYHDKATEFPLFGGMAQIITLLGDVRISYESLGTCEIKEGEGCKR